MNFQTSLTQHFPNAIDEEMFFTSTTDRLHSLGFMPKNSIVAIGHCRDELCNSLATQLQANWGNTFSFASLGGLFTAGKTGLAAFMQHAPSLDDRPRYIIFLFSHIGIGIDGDLGHCSRPNQTNLSSACGALLVYQQQRRQRNGVIPFEPTDPEQSLLAQRLAHLPLIDVNNLATLTKRTLDTAVTDVEHAIKTAVELKDADYALIGGVQIHTPTQHSLIFPVTAYAFVSAQRQKMEL